MDNLKYMLSAYFHQDWNHTHDSWQAVVDEFVTDDLPTVAAVPDEIDQVLTEAVGDAEMELLLKSFGCVYDPAEGDRAWLAAVRDRIRQRLTAL